METIKNQRTFPYSNFYRFLKTSSSKTNSFSRVVYKENISSTNDIGFVI